MSTEHQRYSTDNQASVIRHYAERRDFEIIKTYADEGKSGLSLVGRDALNSLLSDVESGNALFVAILVYDVSRWGRFQDPDEAAEIELRCKRRGIRVHYCAEQFENDGSISSSIVKTVKRAMAGEYSRELSVKVFSGQSNLIRRGFRQGGSPGIGLRRVLVGEDGLRKFELSAGERKSIATDRVVLAPGPEHEIALVDEIYNRFVNVGQTEGEIAAELNLRGLPTDLGRPWTRGTIHEVLINEKYIGNNVWGRTSFKLKKIHTKNPESDWIRANAVFPPLVELALFERARSIIAKRSERLSDAEMLAKLADILQAKGELSGLIIDEMEECPSSSAFRTRFGSLLRAYALVGFKPEHDYRYLEVNRELRRMHLSLMRDVLERLYAAGGKVTQDPQTDLLMIDDFSASIVFARCFHTSAGALRWKIRLDTVLKPDVTVVIRMAAGNSEPLDYYLLPRLDMQEAVLRLCEFNGLSLDAYRFGSLDRFYEMAGRVPISEAA